MQLVAKMSDPKNEAKLEILKSGRIIGTTVAGSAATAAATAAAVNVASAASTAHLLGLATGAFSQFAPIIASWGLPTTPALWALVALNPATGPIAGAVGGAIGAVAAYKLAKKIFD
jgi:hypothetical protein